MTSCRPWYPRTLPEGIYESLLTRDLLARLADLKAITADVPEAQQASALGDHVGRRVTKALEAVPPAERVALVNALLRGLDGDDGRARSTAALSVARQEQPGVWTLLGTRPSVPLSRPALLTNSSTDPKLGAELRAELATADQVDLLCAFVKWYGLRVLEDQLLARHQRGVPLRVLTTTYMGATDRTALDRLVRDFGAEVKVNYETQSTRLHAKAWLFRRHSGYDTAYVGSSNLSRAALLDGLEWNVKLAGSHTPELTAKFEATFDTYWADPAFVTYDPDQRPATGSTEPSPSPAGCRSAAPSPAPSAGSRSGPTRTRRPSSTGSGWSARPTATTATWWSPPPAPARPSSQRWTTPGCRAVRRCCSSRTARRSSSSRCGPTARSSPTGRSASSTVGGEVPYRWRHVFASVQSLSAAGLQRLAVDQFEVVVVDEFHHAEAATYRRLLEHLEPTELLGLTATPERSDGLDVRTFFGGRTAAELRLWDALENDLLCPFHYFGISDATDLSRLDWRAGDYSTSALENLYTADDARVRIVLRELRDKVLDPTSMRALGFCVSVKHAQFMADRFNAAGIPARAVSGSTSREDRADALQALRDRTVNVLFAVDLFNEGLDVPDVDTLLLLRPTQSATIFLQQLGRGLRRTADKPVLTVLDFIGQQSREFRFDLKYRALTGASRSGLERQLESGFGLLPSGCELVLDAVARDVVLDNVRRQLRLSRKELLHEVRSHGDLSLADWLRESGRELADVFKAGSWTGLRREAGLPAPAAGPIEEQLLKRTSAFAHVDDPERAGLYLRLLGEGWTYDELSEREQRLARMMFFSLWPNAAGYTSYQEGFDVLAAHPAVRDEIRQVVELGLAEAQHVALPLGPGLQQVTLQTHAHYSRDEILAGLGWAGVDGGSPRKTAGFASGVVWAPEAKADAFMVTLTKDEKHFSPQTMYSDYAISRDTFHWESQNATAEASPTGQRYVHHAERGSHVLLFVRATRSNSWGGTATYQCLGPATYVSHEGERPMAITWRLRHGMPVDTFRVASVVA